MKCALEMVATTKESRAGAVEREALKAEMRRQEIVAKTKILVENILAEFEKDFKNWSGEPQRFTKGYILADIAPYYPGGSIDGWNSDHRYFYPLEERKDVYADGRSSYDSNITATPVDLTLMIEMLQSLCYKVTYISQTAHLPGGYWGAKFCYGCGAITFPRFTLSIAPECC